MDKVNYSVWMHCVILLIVPILSNSEHTTVIFFDVVLKNAKISSSTSKNSLKMLNEKFIKISETANCIFDFPEALENFTEVSKGSTILTPLLSIVNPRTFAFTSKVSPFKTILETSWSSLLQNTFKRKQSKGRPGVLKLHCEKTIERQDILIA